MPSMTALLALLAVAGYQHRDKIAEMIGGAGRGGPGTGPADEAGQRGGAALPGAGASAGVGGLIGGGLKELVDRFRQSGHGETADSWVAHGPNRDLAPGQLETVLDAETLDTISRQTGLPREEVLARLTRELPSAVDRYTPDGRLPG
jgi:uncharacterized protein YidB (DUF937 family)